MQSLPRLLLPTHQLDDKQPDEGEEQTAGEDRSPHDRHVGVSLLERRDGDGHVEEGAAKGKHQHRPVSVLPRDHQERHPQQEEGLPVVGQRIVGVRDRHRGGR